jgi:hypothetical protein
MLDRDRAGTPPAQPCYTPHRPGRCREVAPQRDFSPDDVLRLYRKYLRHERELLKQVARRRSHSIANYLHGLKQIQQLLNRIAHQQAKWQSIVNPLVEPSRSMLLAIARLADDERWLNELYHLSSAILPGCQVALQNILRASSTRDAQVNKRRFQDLLELQRLVIDARRSGSRPGAVDRKAVDGPPARHRILCLPGHTIAPMERMR